MEYSDSSSDEFNDEFNNNTDDTDDTTTDSVELDELTYPDLSHYKIPKMFLPEEYDFLQKCRKKISELTGEEFLPAAPDWHRFAGMQIEFDGYNDNLKMAINYVPTKMYNLPMELSSLYNDRIAYDEFLGHINTARIITASMNNVAIIPIPGICDDATLHDYLISKLHQLTKFRVWVGAPRCKCL